MKKIFLLLTISTLTLLSCSSDDSAPVENQEPQPTVQENILRVYAENNFIVNVFYWFTDSETPSGSAQFSGQNTSYASVNSAQLLKKVVVKTSADATEISVNLNHTNLSDKHLDSNSKYELILKVVNGVTVLDQLNKIDN